MDSYGGEVTKCFSTCSRLLELKSQYGLRYTSILNEAACSAAYAIASVADKIYAVEGSEVGSIGVVFLRLDKTEYDVQEGLKYHIFRSKPLKALGSAHEALSEKEVKSIENDLTFLDSQFNLYISQRRGLSVEQIVNLQGQTFFGKEAKDLGLVDEVVKHFTKEIFTIQEGDSKMADAKMTVEDVPKDLVSEIAQKAVLEERERVLYTLKLGKELNIPEQTVLKYVSNGMDEDSIKTVFSSIAEAMQDLTKVMQEQQSNAPTHQAKSLHDVLSQR